MQYFIIRVEGDIGLNICTDIIHKFIRLSLSLVHF